MTSYHNYSRTSLIRTPLIRISGYYVQIFIEIQVSTMVFQLTLLRLIRTPEKANKFLLSVGVHINEVLLYVIFTFS